MDRPSKGRVCRLTLQLFDGTWLGYPQQFLNVHKAGNRKEGYVYSIVSFGSGTFHDHELTEAERVELITALGGTP